MHDIADFGRHESAHSGVQNVCRIPVLIEQAFSHLRDGQIILQTCMQMRRHKTTKRCASQTKRLTYGSSSSLHPPHCLRSEDG